MSKLRGKVAVITGAGSGMGRASARLFAQEGAQLVLFGRDQAKLESTAHLIGGEALVVTGDLAHLADLDRLVAASVDRFSAIDVLYLNAGNAPFAPIEATDEALFDACFGVNVRGRYFAIQKFLPIYALPLRSS